MHQTKSWLIERKYHMIYIVLLPICGDHRMLSIELLAAHGGFFTFKTIMSGSSWQGILFVDGGAVATKIPLKKGWWGLVDSKKPYVIYVLHTASDMLNCAPSNPSWSPNAMISMGTKGCCVLIILRPFIHTYIHIYIIIQIYRERYQHPANQWIQHIHPKSLFENPYTVFWELPKTLLNSGVRPSPHCQTRALANPPNWHQGTQKRSASWHLQWQWSGFLFLGGGWEDGILSTGDTKAPTCCGCWLLGCWLFGC